MRVLHVTPYFAPAFRYGGPPRSVLGLCKGLQHAGVHVDVLTTVADGPIDLPASPPEGSEYEGVPVRYVARGFPWLFFGARMRAPLSAALPRTDLVHIHGIWNVPEWSAARWANANDVPYVLSPRGMLHRAARRHGHVWRKRIAFRLLERSRLAGADVLHATSDAEAGVLRALGLDVPIVVAPNGVDLDAAARAQPGFRKRLAISPRAFVILYLGRMHPIKRLDLLAAAFDKVRAAHSATHLVFAGPDDQGHLAGVMRRLTSHAGFVHAVDTLTEDDKWSLLRDADVSVQCSDSESFGVAVVEAMAAAVPVVVTRTCPWADIETRQCGFWVDQTAAAIADAIHQLAGDPARAKAMGERGAAFARERYGWDAIALAMAATYDRILAGRRDHVA